MAKSNVKLKGWEEMSTTEKGLGMLVAGAVVAAMMWGLGGVFGLSGTQAFAFALVMVVAGWVVASSSRELSFAFAFVTMAGVLTIYALLPADVQQATPIPEVLQALGLDGTLGAFDAIKLASTALLATFVYWVVTLRAGGGPQRPETVFTGIFGTGEGERKGKATQLVETYITFTRVGVGFFVFGVVTLASEVGNLSGILVSFLSEAPVVVSNVVTIVLGWTAMGGELPVIGDVSFLGVGPAGWLLISAAILLVAVGTRNES